MPPPLPSIERLGPFKLVRTLGQGGFAPVWLAEEIYDGKKLRDVALKVFIVPPALSGSTAGAELWRQEILEEARALCRVEHPNIVRFYSLSRDDERGAIGLAMELVHGKSLDAIVREEGQLEERRVLDIGINVAWALAAVHDAGLVHRDVKPGNIIQGAHGYKLIDFGIVVDAPSVLLRAAVDAPSVKGEAARAAEGPTDETLDPTVPQLAGTPGYVAPECAQGARPTPASDIYALGVTLFKLSTGRVPDAGMKGRGRGRGPSAPASGSLPARSSKQKPRKSDSLAEVTALLREPDPSLRPRHADWVARELERIHEALARPRSAARRSKTRAFEASSPERELLRKIEGLAKAAPLPLAPLFLEAERALRHEGSTDISTALGELGLGVLGYAFGVGMAALAATPDHPIGERLALELEACATGAWDPVASWCSLVRSLHACLGPIDPSLERALAFAADPALAEDLGALLGEASPAIPDRDGAQRIALVLDRAGSLLSIPLVFPSAEVETVQLAAGGASFAALDLRTDRPPEPYVLLGDRRATLPPWLPYDSGRLLLPEAPAAPGKPWRATDPASGERRDDHRLDDAVRRLIRQIGDVPREPRFDPPIVGREGELVAISRAASHAARGSVQIVLITGPLGIGRTRLLNAAVAEACVSQATSLYARCTPERKSPLRPLLRALDERERSGGRDLQMLKGSIERAVAPAVLPGGKKGNEALEEVEAALLGAGSAAPIVLGLDDIQWADAQTLGLIELLIERADLGATSRLLVVASARDEPNPSAPLRSLLSAVRRSARAAKRSGSAVNHLALGPLAEAPTRALAQAVCPLDPALEQAVARGSGGVPFFVLHALFVWRERGAMTWDQGAWRATTDRAQLALLDDVPGVADLIADRLASYLKPNSPLWRAALSTLAAVALYGGGLSIDMILRAGVDEKGLEKTLDVLVNAGILAVSGGQAATGGHQEYSFAQEMVRQAALNLVRHKPWFYRLHRALLDAIASGPSAEADAAFLASGYTKLGARDEARAWLARAMESAISGGRFSEAAAFGADLAAISVDPEVQRDVELASVWALVRGRLFEEARSHLARLDARASVLPASGPRARSQGLRRRILRLEAARWLSEAIDDPTLVADADALGDPVLRCEARLSLAGISTGARAMELVSEAVDLGERCGPAVEFAARALRIELCYAARGPALSLASSDLSRSLAIAVATSSTWQQIHTEGDLAVLEAELGRVGAAIERLFRLEKEAEASGMRGLLRIICHNLAICLMREGRAREASEAAKRAADLASEAGDPILRAATLSFRAYALRHTGELDAALACAGDAERLQRERGEPRVAQTLLRRAEILEAMGRMDEALAAARAARVIADQHGNKMFGVSARLWEAVHRFRRGEAAREELERAIAEVEAAGVGRNALVQSLMEQASTLLAAGAGPP